MYYVTANTENQLNRYHSNHHFSNVQMKPECSCVYINKRPTVIKINAFSLQQMFKITTFHTDTKLPPPFIDGIINYGLPEL